MNPNNEAGNTTANAGNNLGPGSSTGFQNQEQYQTAKQRVDELKDRGTPLTEAEQKEYDSSTQLMSQWEQRHGDKGSQQG